MGASALHMPSKMAASTVWHALQHTDTARGDELARLQAKQNKHHVMSHGKRSQLDMQLIASTSQAAS